MHGEVTLEGLVPDETHPADRTLEFHRIINLCNGHNIESVKSVKVF